MIFVGKDASGRGALGCAALAMAVRGLLLAAFHGSVLYAPAGDGAHDRSIYLQAMQQVAGGTYFPAGAFDFLPLYPWLTGTLAALFGPGLLLASLFGIFCDGITTALIVLAAQRLGAGAKWAVAAGLLYAVYPLAAIYSLLNMPNTLNALGVTGFVYAALRLRKPSARNAMVLGLVAGVVSLGFAGMLLMALAVFAAWMRENRAPLSRAFLLLAGLAVPLIPVAWHNSRAEGELVLLTTHGGLNFYMGNHDRATGYPLRILNFRMTARAMLEDAHRHAEQMEGRTLSRAESSDWWKQQARAYWRENPAQALLLTVKKVFLFWNWRDVDDLRMLEQLRISDPFFRHVHGAPFAIFSVLGLTGLCLARRAAIPRLALLAGMAGLVLFFITARYRLTLVPLMASLGVAAMSGCRVEGKAGIRKLMWIVFPASALVLLPFPLRDQRAVDHYNVAIQLISAQRDGEAARVIEEGLSIAPDSADLHFARGNLRFKQEKFQEAAQAFAESLARHPNNPTAVFNLALSFARDGQYCQARDVLARADKALLDDRSRALLRELSAACPP